MWSSTFVDEVGYLTYGTDAANMLFHVVNDRHRKRRAMIFTTNKPLSAWGRVLHDDDLAHAIVDRILERGRMLTLDGPSMRTKHLGLDDSTALQASDQVATISGIEAPEFPEPTSRTFAKRLGVMPLLGVASVGSGVTGREASIRAAVLPTMQVGSAALTNVVLLVIDDENLRIGSGRAAYQIDAILGYPILKALGVVTFTRDEFLAGDAAEPSGEGVRMYMRGLPPAIECEVEGRPLLFTFDTGAASTDLSVRYYELFHHQAASWKKRTFESGVAGGSIQQDAYIQSRVVMKVGTSAVTLSDVSILPVRTNADIDLLFGNLGQDFVDRFDSVSPNFSAMTFSVGAPVKTQ
jgi:hypothetical protein